MSDTDFGDDSRITEDFATPGRDKQNIKPAAKKTTKTKSRAQRFTRPKRSSYSSVTSKTAKSDKLAPAIVRTPLQEQSANKHTRPAKDDAAVLEAKSNAIDDAVSKAASKRKADNLEDERPRKVPLSQPLARVQRDGDFEFTPKPNRKFRNAGLESHTTKRTRITSNESEDDGISSPKHRSNKITTATSQKTGTSPDDRHARTVTSPGPRASENQLRRRLGEVTTKLEKLESKYYDLRDIGIKEAESNYDRLRSKSEAKATAATNLITSLKKEIEMYRSISQESQSEQQQMHDKLSELARAQTEAEELTKLLSNAQNENAILQTKLAQTRSGSVPLEGGRTPANGRSRTIVAGNADTVQGARLAQMKEDLYSDLTGLIIRGIDVASDAETYDCIQTGKNGTLHFKLSIAKEEDETFDNTEFQYTPCLDENRDRDLLSILPDYLTDEIAFSRTNAAMFYGRVIETLIKKRTSA